MSIDDLTQQLRDAQDRITMLQDRLSESEQDKNALQADFQQLRASAQKMADMAFEERNKLAQQISALKETIGKYQTQLNQQQQLMVVVQAHRQELLQEVESQKSNVKQLQDQQVGFLRLDQIKGTPIGGLSQFMTSAGFPQGNVTNI